MTIAFRQTNLANMVAGSLPRASRDGKTRTSDGDEVKYMLFRNISGKSGIGRPCPWILGAVLGLMIGPASGQEGWGSFSQPDVAARAAVLMNAETGEILFAKEPHLRLPPASTTKVPVSYTHLITCGKYYLISGITAR